jgi:hypothetical protein
MPFYFGFFSLLLNIYIILPQVYYITTVLHVIHYSCIFLILAQTAYLLLNYTYVKMWISRGQYAWLVNKRLFTSHQRLNEEDLENNKNNKIWFEQWLVGITDGDYISYILSKW